MRKLWMITGIFLLIGNWTAAQTPREEKLQSYRIAVFTEALQLTPDEAQRFWPVYNEYLDRKESLQEQYKPGKSLELMSDTEVEDQIKRYFEKQERELDLERDLFQKLRDVLPTRKLAKVPFAERRFRESLIQKLQEARDRRQQNMGGRRN